MRRNSVRYASLLVLAVVSAAAQAQLTATFNESAFDAAHPSASLVNFNGLADQSYTALEIANGVDFGPFTVQGIGARAGDLRISNHRLLISADGLFGTATFKFIFDQPSLAMGLDLRGVNDDGLTFAGGGDSVSTVPGQPLSGDFFYGIDSTNPLTSFTVFPTGIGSGFDNYEVDNVRLATPVPEPATMAALGLGALALHRRRKA